jgi:Bacterial protein of unknown function (DUF922)
MKNQGIFKLLRIFLLLSFPMLANCAQNPGGDEIVVRSLLDGDEIKWNSDFRLDWSHFKGKPDRTSNMDALTESGITFSWSCDWRGFRLEAYAIFVPTGSWVKEPSNILLTHEQLHFDITEIHARLIRKFFAEYPDACRLGKAGIDRAAQTIIQASYDTQEAYDQATNHGQNVRVQREWQAKIAEQLASLSDYAY